MHERLGQRLVRLLPQLRAEDVDGQRLGHPRERDAEDAQRQRLAEHARRDGIRRGQADNCGADFAAIDLLTQSRTLADLWLGRFDLGVAYDGANGQCLHVDSDLAQILQ